MDSTHVYWANSTDGTIDEARLNPLGPATTLISGQASPWGVAVESGHIYWANSGDGTIKEAPLTGGPVTTLVTGQDNPEGLAVDSGHIYWANNGIGGTINEAPLTGGPVTTLVTGQISRSGWRSARSGKRPAAGVPHSSELNHVRLMMARTASMTTGRLPGSGVPGAASPHRPGVKARRSCGWPSWRRGDAEPGGYGLRGEVVTEHGDPPVADTEDLHE